MRRRRARLASFLLAACLAVEAQQNPVPPDFKYPASWQTEVRTDVRHSRRLKGVVRGRSDVLVTGPILVELIDSPAESTRLDARFCDADGYFDFGKKPRGSYIVRVSMLGWDTQIFPLQLGIWGVVPCALS